MRQAPMIFNNITYLTLSKGTTPPLHPISHLTFIYPQISSSAAVGKATGAARSSAVPGPPAEPSRHSHPASRCSGRPPRYRRVSAPRGAEAKGKEGSSESETDRWGRVEQTANLVFSS